MWVSECFNCRPRVLTASLRRKVLQISIEKKLKPLKSTERVSASPFLFKLNGDKKEMTKDK